ncbi:TlpA family protein disulfide reductase [Brevundimonas sp.]|uniref:TlpA family protein disulfide reductase n=1 Tax=Brevundimonas sp. TaxID=1871086 RepID=UPI003A91693D
MSGSKKAGWTMVAAALLILTISGGALLYVNRAAVFKAPVAAEAPKSELARFATGSLARLETPGELVMAPDHGFKARDGRAVRFADFRGKVVVVNLWAMWCAPCRTEMPTIARMADLYAGRDLVVLPVNVDTGEDSIADAISFIDVHEPLPFYSDPEFRLPFLFPGKGKMPQTILLDRQGRIRAAFAGEADWTSAEARALIDALLAEPD